MQYKHTHRTHTHPFNRYITYTEIVRKVADRIQHFLRIVPCGFLEYLGDLAGILIAYLYLDEWQTNWKSGHAPFMDLLKTVEDVNLNRLIIKIHDFFFTHLSACQE